MSTTGISYCFDDRTGANDSTFYDEIYDRMFLSVATMPGKIPNTTRTCIYETGRRSSAHARNNRHGEPSVVLEFAQNNNLGTVNFVQKGVSMLMGHWMRKTSMFGKSSSRKFRASDGQEYKWLFRSVPGQEWTCTNANEYIIAHYNVKPAGEPSYRSSGNVFVVYEAYADLAIELLTTLTVMRHIQQHNL